MTTTDKVSLGKRITKRRITYVWSEELKLMFRASVNDPRNKRLEMIASAHEELHRQYTVRPRKRIAA